MTKQQATAHLVRTGARVIDREAQAARIADRPLVVVPAPEPRRPCQFCGGNPCTCED